METALCGCLIAVRDMDRSVAFYQDVLELTAVRTEDQITLLSDPSGLPALFLIEGQRDAAHRDHPLGIVAVLFSFATEEDLDLVEARLKAHGAFGSRQHNGDIESVHGRDPDFTPLSCCRSLDGKPVSARSLTKIPLALYGL